MIGTYILQRYYSSDIFDSLLSLFSTYCWIHGYCTDDDLICMNILANSFHG